VKILHSISLIITLLLLSGCGNQAQEEEHELPGIVNFGNANSRETYFTIHNIKKAWPYSKGAGVKVGILDSFFAYQFYPELYAGGLSFQKENLHDGFNTVPHHGFWMATTLREVAPEVEIYALGIVSPNENDQTQSMIKAINWAVENELDILTLSLARMSEEHRRKIDTALEEAYRHGIITTFIHYPHPQNILPSKIEPRGDDAELNPKVNIYKYDYNVFMYEAYREYVESGKRVAQKPFLSISSKSPVLAGFVAMIRSLDPDLGSEEIEQLLVQTSYTFESEDTIIFNSVDMGAAVRRLVEGE